MELIRGPRPARGLGWAQRIAGCTIHAHASVYAVEDALGVEPANPA
jgi:Ni,Fe-hydrogenase I large subunit